MTISFLANRIRSAALVCIAGCAAAAVGLLAAVAGAMPRSAGRSCRCCCEACCCCSWQPAWPDRRRPGRAVCRCCDPSGCRAGGGPRRPAVEITPRTTFAPANRFRSTCACGPRRPARPRWNCSATGSRCSKETMPLVAGETQRAFPTVVQKPSQVVYSVRVKSDQRARWPDENAERLCRLRRSAAAGAAGRKPAGPGRTSQESPGRRECRGRSPAGTARRPRLPPTT